MKQNPNLRIPDNRLREIACIFALGIVRMEDARPQRGSLADLRDLRALS
ncbi:hypothetical protein KQI63_08825 [bacterium]|nr:hypothetical protein [bacterium]